MTLKGVNRELTGNYQCEVSEDEPLFHTDIRAAHMQVIELPKDEPVMQVDKKVITMNDNFKAVCTVGSSYPPANITWYINGRKVSFRHREISWNSNIISLKYNHICQHICQVNIYINVSFFHTLPQHSTDLQNTLPAHQSRRIRRFFYILLA